MAEKKSFLQRRKKTLIILGVIALIAVMFVVNTRSKREKTVKVTIDTVKPQDHLTSTVSASGEVKPKKSINISAQVPGRIIKIGVKEGDEVKAGDFLLKLDSTQYEANAEAAKSLISTNKAQLIQAEARLERDKSAYERQQKLSDQELISKDQLEAAKAEYNVSDAQVNAINYQIRQAESNLKSSMDNLGKTLFTSPIDGIITSLKVEEGETAIIGTMNNPGTVLMTIADLSVMEVEVEVDETDVVGVKLSQEAKVRVDAYPNQVFKGKVTEIGSSALQKTTAAVSSSTQESKDFKVVVTLENPPQKLKPGLSASADVVTAEKKQVLAVPIAALVLRDVPQAKSSSDQAKSSSDKAAAEKKEEEGVFVVENGRAKFQPVTKGITGGMMIEVVAGLKENQEIVTGPYAALRELKDGVLVKSDVKKDVKPS